MKMFNINAILIVAFFIFIPNSFANANEPELVSLDGLESCIKKSDNDKTNNSVVEMPLPDIRLIESWFEKVNNISACNKTDFNYLLSVGARSRVTNNITWATHYAKDEVCKKKFEKLSNSLDEWVSYLKVTKNQDVNCDEDKNNPAASKKHSLPTYIVDAELGVNVRDNPLSGKTSKKITTLAENSPLKLISSELVEDIDGDKWGEFEFKDKNGQTEIGWIKIKYLKIK